MAGPAIPTTVSGPSDNLGLTQELQQSIPTNEQNVAAFGKLLQLVQPQAPQAGFDYHDTLRNPGQQNTNAPIVPNAPYTPTPLGVVGKGSQKQAQFDTLMENITNNIRTANIRSQEKAVRSASANWTRLMVALQSGDKAVINDILGDPKQLKNMAKALNFDFLNPSKGADNVYRKGLMAAIAKHQLKQGMLGKLRDLLTGYHPNVQLSPAQHQQLAQQMLQRIPHTGGAELFQRQAWNNIYSGHPTNADWASVGLGPSSQSELAAFDAFEKDSTTGMNDAVKNIISAKNAETQRLRAQDLGKQIAGQLNHWQAADTANAAKIQQSQDHFTKLLPFVRERAQAALIAAKSAKDRTTIIGDFNNFRKFGTQVTLLNDQMTQNSKLITGILGQIKAVTTARGTTGQSGFFNKQGFITDTGKAKLQQLQSQYNKLLGTHKQLMQKMQQLQEQYTTNAKQILGMQPPPGTASDPLLSPQLQDELLGGVK